MTDQLLVRLKPYDPVKLQLMKTWTAPWGTRFVGGTWYRVNREAAEYMATVHEDPTDARSPLAFNVFTEEDAATYMAQEEARALGRVIVEKEIGVPTAPMTAEVSVDTTMNRPRPIHELAAAVAAVPPREAPDPFVAEEKLFGDAALVDRARQRQRQGGGKRKVDKP